MSPGPLVQFHAFEHVMYQAFAPATWDGSLPRPVLAGAVRVCRDAARRRGGHVLRDAGPLRPEEVHGPAEGRRRLRRRQAGLRRPWRSPRGRPARVLSHRPLPAVPGGPDAAGRSRPRRRTGAR